MMVMTNTGGTGRERCTQYRTPHWPLVHPTTLQVGGVAVRIDEIERMSVPWGTLF